MAKKIDVLILIEHKAREIESAVLLKHFFENKGYYVVVDSIKFHKESVVLKYRPKVAIVPWAYSNKEVDLFRSFNRFGNRTIILNMHHEQISNDSSDAFIVPKDDAKKIIHVSWGSNYTKKLLQAKCKASSIIQCGNPRLDFYKSNLQKISVEKTMLSRKYDLDSSKKWILFIANSFHLLSETQINTNVSKGVDIKEQISSSVINRNDFLKFTSEYLKDYDDTIFIYRPHPSYAHIDQETTEIKELTKKQSNFRCISKNSIRDWIINVDLAISFHSTSVIECAVADIPFYLFRTEELPIDKDYRFFNNYKYLIKDYHDFLNAIRDGEDFSYASFNETIKEYIDLNNDRYSAEIIANKSLELLNEMKEEIEYVDFSLYHYIKTIFLCWAKKIVYYFSKMKIIRDWLGKTGDIRYFNLLYEGDDHFDQSDIASIEEKLSKILRTHANDWNE